MEIRSFSLFEQKSYAAKSPRVLLPAGHRRRLRGDLPCARAERRSTRARNAEAILREDTTSTSLNRKRCLRMLLLPKQQNWEVVKSLRRISAQGRRRRPPSTSSRKGRGSAPGTAAFTKMAEMKTTQDPCQSRAPAPPALRRRRRPTMTARALARVSGPSWVEPPPGRWQPRVSHARLGWEASSEAPVPTA